MGFLINAVDSCGQWFLFLFLFFQDLTPYLRESEWAKGRERERAQVGEEEADSPLSREANVGLIPRPWDHDLSQRQILNRLSYLGTPDPVIICERIFLKILFIYSWETEREKKAETQAEEEADSMQRAWCGTCSQDPEIMTWAKGRYLTEPSRRSNMWFFFFNFNAHDNSLSWLLLLLFQEK